MALAVALAYSGTGVVHLALGQTGTAGALTASALLGRGLPLWAAVPVGLAVGSALSGAAERGLVATAPGRPVLAAVLLVAAGVVVQEVLVGVFRRPGYAFPRAPGTFLVLGGIVHGYDLAVVAAVVVAAGAGLAVLRGPRVGVALRLTARAPVAAERIGVDTSTVRTATFAVAGLVATGAALLAAPRLPLVATGGSTLALRGVAAAAAGRMTSPGRILVAALVVGVAEVVGQYYVIGSGELLADAAAVGVVVVGWRP